MGAVMLKLLSGKVSCGNLNHIAKVTWLSVCSCSVLLEWIKIVSLLSVLISHRAEYKAVHNLPFSRPS